MKPGGTILLLFLAACNGAVPPPPANLDDACKIRAERPEWFSAMTRVEQEWQVPIHVQLAIIHQESRFRARARTPLSFKLGVIPMGRYSSAYGYAQVIDSTWKWYQRDTGNLGARRDNFSDAVDFMGWYMDQSQQKLGIPKTNARKQYLAYHDGHSGYRRGTHRHKRWLLRISRQVERRAHMYERQLRQCVAPKGAA